MKKGIRCLLIFASLFIVGFLGFYKFMTYDRTHTWAKEYKEDISAIAENNGFRIIKSDLIDINTIRLPTERGIKMRIQRALSKVNLMNYGKAYGENILLRNNNKNDIVNCKAWCLSDHLIGLEIEYKNLDKIKLANLKSDFEQEFWNCNIVWKEIE